MGLVKSADQTHYPQGTSTMKIKRLEKDVQRSIMEYAKLTGWNVYRINNGAVYNAKAKAWIYHGTPGVSDLLVVHPVKHIAAFVEVKRPGGKATEDQVRFLAMVNGCETVGIVAHSIDEFKEQLDGITKQ
jgi:hypothetical protein